jgi:hypothetical protein
MNRINNLRTFSSLLSGIALNNFISTQIHGVATTFPESHCTTLREPCNLIVVKPCLYMFKPA